MYIHADQMTEVTRKCVKFTLNTSMFYPNGNGSVAGAGAMDPTMGYSDPVRVNSVFRNVDWIRVMGAEMYNEFKTFNLCLTSVTYCSAGATAFGHPAFNYGVIVRGVGLPWLSSYDLYSRTDTGAVDLWSGNISDNLDCKSVNTFRRPAPQTDFHIKLYRAGDNTQNISGVDKPAGFVFCFEIYGCEKA
jgi:hypothetical protein